ncbi:MAB_1171c family putative transporter [Streptomyces sp. ODS28]|uniref:MAB_1171c family putative transporter n=1 Tax=Streptomyces sp. ODS28 TaxID=3136688 RepID=UPI0031EC947A
MFTLAFFKYTAAVFLTVVALWRAPASLRYGDLQRRALCGCYAGFAASAWLQTPAVAASVAHAPVAEVSVLAQECLGTAAIASIIAYVGAAYGRSDEESPPRYVVISRFIARISPRVALGVVVALTFAFFALVDRRGGGGSVDFAAEHAGEWGAAAFLSVIYAYLAASCSVTGYQWASAARRAETRPLRTGLSLMALAMVIGMLYVVIRTVFIWAAVAAPEAGRELAPTVARLTGVMPPLLLVTFSAGSSIPTVRAAVARWAGFRLLRELEPLWRDLIRVFPDLAFENALPGRGRGAGRPTPLWRDLTDWSLPLGVRLSSRVHQIADGVEQLRGYAPPGLFHAAEDAVEEAAEEAEDPPNPQAAAEALYIRAALCAAARGLRLPSGEVSEALPRKALSRTEDEARWWRQVQREYAALSPAEGEALLAEVAPDLDSAL